mmetsp:Transcript_28702/g.38224  ORF Transcript_28702/g.38224 Transcript_28702/m.38224 type:complete len:532 (-) Transcript_28702:187-1782(-)
MEIDKSTTTTTTTTNTSTPLFDLESYISRYDKTSETKLQRLLFIAKHSSAQEDILKSCYEMMEDHCREHGNVKRYKEIFGPDHKEGETPTDASIATSTTDSPSSSSSSSPHPSTLGFHYDAAFLAEKESSSAHQLDNLEAQLKTAQVHLTKDSVRSIYLKMGEFYKARGELREALHKVKRSQDYCTNHRQNGQVCLMVIELGIDLRFYNEVRIYITKAEHTSDLLSNDSEFASKLAAASALVSLSESHYADAALKFASLSSELTNQFNSVLSAEDIALYGGLLGLASLDRQSLQSSLLDSTKFKGRLELVPPLRDALRHYVRAEYKPCLSLLSSLLPQLRLDIHLASHIDTLMEMIRHRCIIQYFIPYNTASIVTMAQTFGMEMEEMEATLVKLIGEGRMPGRPRIDSLRKMVSTESVRNTERRKRREMEGKVKKMGETFVRETEGMILRMSCLDHGLVVQNDAKQRSFRSGGTWGGGGGGNRSQRSRGGGVGGGAQGMYEMDDSSDDDVAGGSGDMMDMEGYGCMNPEDV